MANLYKDYTDDALLDLWKQGDEEAFERFYQRYHLKFANLALKKIYDEYAVEELVNDTFVALYFNKERVKNNPAAYCHGVLKHKIANYYREKRNITSAVVADAATHYAVEYKELEAQVQSHIAALPEQCRQVFLLRKEANLTNKQVAEKLGISIKTVEIHMTKARAILRQKLEYYMLVGVIISWNLLK